MGILSETKNDSGPVKMRTDASGNLRLVQTAKDIANSKDRSMKDLEGVAKGDINPFKQDFF